MDFAASLRYIAQENPELLADMQALVAACPAERERLNRIFVAIGLIKGQCVEKRNAAMNLIGFRGTGFNGEFTKSQTLRQPPDVMIRRLCQIAEVAHEYAGDPAFLDALEARNG
jgi:hypothetical protein